MAAIHVEASGFREPRVGDDSCMSVRRLIHQPAPTESQEGLVVQKAAAPEVMART